jgi:hypothetical protein
MAPVPRYYFHFPDGAAGRDMVGEELPDRAAAWEEATVILGQAARDHGPALLDRPLRLQVTDQFHNPILELHVGARLI